MAAFDGPAKPLLSLNPQEDAKFKKEVAQVRRRATKVSGRRGPDREGRWRTGSGSPRHRCAGIIRSTAALAGFKEVKKENHSVVSDSL